MSQLLTASKLVLTFLVSSLLGYLAFSQPLVAQNNQQEDFTNQTNILINRSTNLSPTRLDFSDLSFSLNQDTNLYLVLYSQFVAKTQERAVKGTAALHGISDTKVERLVIGNDTSVITTQDTDNIPAKIQAIQSTYELEKNLFQTLSYLETQTLALELFSNADTSDSDFDLIDDLDRIETLLFAQISPSQFAQLRTKTKSSASNLVDGGFSGSYKLGVDPEVIQSDSPLNQLDPMDQSELDSSNPLTCPIDPDLHNQLETFKKSQLESLAASNNIEDGDENSLLPNSFAASRLGLVPQLKPLAKTSSRCPNAIFTLDDLFCLRLEKVEPQAGLRFVGEQHCINCIIENLAKLSSNLVSASLSPRKITGKFGEPAFCKQHLFRNFTMNINFIPRPARSDLELVDSIEEYEVTPKKPNVPSLSQERPIELVYGELKTTLTNVAETQTLISGIIANEQNIRDIEADTDIQSVSQFIKDMEIRLSVFNENFIRMREQINKIQSNFEQITNKPVCN